MSPRALNWYLQRITGAALLVLLIMHFWVTHFTAEVRTPTGLTFEVVQRRFFHNPWFVAIDITFLFIALYHALFFSIELRGAPFIGWIVDLSVADPFYVYPVLMGATMFLQQRLTPSIGDPMQQKIMMFLPIVFTFLFISFPSGLVIYWTVNNMLTITQQYYIYHVSKE